MPTPTGSVKLRIRPNTQNGQEIRVKGRGLPKRGSAQKGDLIVTTRVVLPRLDDEARKQLEPILAAIPQPDPAPEAELDRCEPIDSPSARPRPSSARSSWPSRRATPSSRSRTCSSSSPSSPTASCRPSSTASACSRHRWPTALRQELAKLPKVSGDTQLQLSSEARRVLTDAHAVAERMKDEYVSTEHLLLAALEAGGSTAARIMQQAGVTPATVLEALTEIRGQPARDEREPRSDLRGAREVRPRPDRGGPQGRARPGHRPRRGDPPRHPGAQPADEEQPGPDRRAGRRQDGHRRRARPAHRARRRARGAARQAGRRARPGRADRRREVPRRVRGAPQGGAQGGHRLRRPDHPVHRRAAHRRRRRRQPRARWTPPTC